MLSLVKVHQDITSRISILSSDDFQCLDDTFIKKIIQNLAEKTLADECFVVFENLLKSKTIINISNDIATSQEEPYYSILSWIISIYRRVRKPTPKPSTTVKQSLPSSDHPAIFRADTQPRTVTSETVSSTDTTCNNQPPTRTNAQPRTVASKTVSSTDTTCNKQALSRADTQPRTNSKTVGSTVSNNQLPTRAISRADTQPRTITSKTITSTGTNNQLPTRIDKHKLVMKRPSNTSGSPSSKRLSPDTANNNNKANNNQNNGRVFRQQSHNQPLNNYSTPVHTTVSRRGGGPSNHCANRPPAAPTTNHGVQAGPNYSSNVNMYYGTPYNQQMGSMPPVPSGGQSTIWNANLFTQVVVNGQSDYSNLQSAISPSSHQSNYNRQLAFPQNQPTSGCQQMNTVHSSSHYQHVDNNIKEKKKFLEDEVLKVVLQIREVMSVAHFFKALCSEKVHFIHSNEYLICETCNGQVIGVDPPSAYLHLHKGQNAPYSHHKTVTYHMLPKGLHCLEEGCALGNLEYFIVEIYILHLRTHENIPAQNIWEMPSSWPTSQSCLQPAMSMVQNQCYPGAVQPHGNPPQLPLPCQYPPRPMLPQRPIIQSQQPTQPTLPTMWRPPTTHQSRPVNHSIPHSDSIPQVTRASNQTRSIQVRNPGHISGQRSVRHSTDMIGDNSQTSIPGQSGSSSARSQGTVCGNLQNLQTVGERIGMKLRTLLQSPDTGPRKSPTAGNNSASAIPVAHQQPGQASSAPCIQHQPANHRPESSAPCVQPYVTHQPANNRPESSTTCAQPYVTHQPANHGEDSSAPCVQPPVTHHPPCQASQPSTSTVQPPAPCTDAVCVQPITSSSGTILHDAIDPSKIINIVPEETPLKQERSERRSRTTDYIDLCDSPQPAKAIAHSSSKQHAPTESSGVIDVDSLDDDILAIFCKQEHVTPDAAQSNQQPAFTRGRPSAPTTFSLEDLYDCQIVSQPQNQPSSPASTVGYGNHAEQISPGRLEVPLCNLTFDSGVSSRSDFSPYHAVASDVSD